MYSISFEGGARGDLPTKEALQVAVKFDRVRRGFIYDRLVTDDKKRVADVVSTEVSLYPYFPEPKRGGINTICEEPPAYTYFLTKALRRLKEALYGIYAEDKKERLTKEEAYEKYYFTEDEIALLFKYFGHPLEKEYAREYAIYEENGLSLFDRKTGEPLRNIPLIWYDQQLAEDQTTRGINKTYHVRYEDLYGTRAPEDVVAELLKTL